MGERPRNHLAAWPAGPRPLTPSRAASRGARWRWVGAETRREAPRVDRVPPRADRGRPRTTTSPLRVGDLAPHTDAPGTSPAKPGNSLARAAGVSRTRPGACSAGGVRVVRPVAG